MSVLLKRLFRMNIQFPRIRLPQQVCREPRYLGHGLTTSDTALLSSRGLGESLLGTDWRNIKGQVLASGNGSRQPSRKQFIDSSPNDSKSTEASTSMSMDELCGVDSASLPSTSRAAEVTEYARHPSVASSTLVELTTRLDFFKERRSQLMEQLHNLDLNYGSTTSQDFVYKPSSPSWS
ncbi:hypothetical protein SESBI_06710 [Sesbania bispinosa]|nr:hypothetical protein SESBI_06710 [Sesbania bispinosa]